MQQEEKSWYPSNAFGRFWQKIPLMVRSIVLGFSITSLGVGLWVLLVSIIPGLLAVLLMVPILILYWKYFSGQWSSSNTQAFRRWCMRQIKLKGAVWGWGLIAAMLIFLFVNSVGILIFRIYEFQPEIIKTARFLDALPLWIAWLMILMASLVAGICEEIGYRGYMQTPMEQKYGPVASISITSVVFVAVHLHQAWANGILGMIVIFVISFMLGYLAYSSKSLLPGMIAHVSFDIINFSYWWSDVLGTFKLKPISMTGVDIHFMVTVMVVIMALVLFIVAIMKLLKYSRRELLDPNLN